MKLWPLIFFISASVLAKTESFELQNKKVTITHPENWETAKDLYGIPLTVLGPYENNSRPVLTILPTNLKKENHSEKDFQKLFQNFKAEKEDWIGTHKGKLLKYEATTKVQPRKDLQGHFIGAEFVINEIHFIERSYYLYCKDEIYNLKYSIRLDHQKYLQDLQKMVGEFKCE
jgi:hypothetical protein